VLDECLAYLKTQKPLGVTAYTLSVEPTVFAFTVAIPANTTSTVRDRLISNVQMLFSDEASPGGTILLSHLNSAMITSGVADYKINAITKDSVSYPVGDLITTGFELATYGSITYTDI